jgi:hypothetical protein
LVSKKIIFSLLTLVVFLGSSFAGSLILSSAYSVSATPAMPKGSSVVQTGYTETVNDASVTVTLSKNVTKGDLIVVIATRNGGLSVYQIYDSQGNAYTNYYNCCKGTNEVKEFQVYLANVSETGPLSVMLHYFPDPEYRVVFVYELHNFAPDGKEKSFNYSIVTGTCCNAGKLKLSEPSLVISVGQAMSLGTWTSPNGWKAIVPESTQTVAGSEYRFCTSGATRAPIYSTSNSTNGFVAWYETAIGFSPT